MDRACRPAHPGLAAVAAVAVVEGSMPAVGPAEAAPMAEAAQGQQPPTDPSLRSTSLVPRDLGDARGGVGGLDLAPLLTSPLQQSPAASGAQQQQSREETRCPSLRLHPADRAAAAEVTVETPSSSAPGDGPEVVFIPNTPAAAVDVPALPGPSHASPLLDATPNTSVRRDQDTVRRVKKRALQRQLLRLQERLYRQVFESDSDTDADARSLSPPPSTSLPPVAAAFASSSSFATTALQQHRRANFRPEASLLVAPDVSMSSPSVCSHGDRRLADAATPGQTGDARALELEVDADGEGAAAVGSSSTAGCSRAYICVESVATTRRGLATPSPESSSLSHEARQQSASTVSSSDANRRPFQNKGLSLASGTPVPLPPRTARSSAMFTSSAMRAAIARPADASEQFCQLWEAICDLEARIRQMESEEEVCEPPDVASSAPRASSADHTAGGQLQLAKGATLQPPPLGSGVKKAGHVNRYRRFSRRETLLLKRFKEMEVEDLTAEFFLSIDHPKTNRLALCH